MLNQNDTTPIVWSFSSLKEFSNCPRKYNELKVKKNYVFQKTEAIIYGEEVHTACELFIKEDKEFPEQYSQFKDVLIALKDFKGMKRTELKLGLTENKKPCGFFDKNIWVRGVIDLLIISGETAYVIDYKTGSDRYPDTTQLKLMSALVFEHYPEVQKIKASLIFLVKDRMIKERYNRSELGDLWKRFDAPLYKLRQAFESDVWNPNPTPLCRYCPVKSCEYNSDH